jgi:hypothetical protein
MCGGGVAADSGKIGDFMRRLVLPLKRTFLRQLAIFGLILLPGLAGAFAQSGEPHAQDPSKPGAAPSDPTKDNQRKTDEFVEAALAIPNASGSAGAWCA